MSLEIERKFHVRDGWEVPPEAVGVLVRQAYLTDPAAEVEVRVRSMDDRYFMTVKKPVAGTGAALSRQEVEFPVDAAVFDPLWAMSSARLEKERWTVPVGAHTAQVDVYRERNRGLRVVEVEFATLEEAERFAPPAWFGAEITGVKRWGNRALAQTPVSG